MASASAPPPPPPPQIDTSLKRIIVTGGSGLVGRHVVEHLVSHGHRVLNLDQTPLPHPTVHTMVTDLTSQAEVLSALSTPQFSLDDYRAPRLPPPPPPNPSSTSTSTSTSNPTTSSTSNIPAPAQGPPPPTADAIIHLAAFPRPLVAPDAKVFATNVSSAWNVIDAACRLGIRKIVLASTQSVYGAAYAPALGEVPWEEFPVREDTYDANPADNYGLSKVVAERIGRSYARRFAGVGVDVYALRIGHVVVPGAYGEWVPRFLGEVELGRRVCWCCVDARDLGQVCRRAVEVSGLGYQVMNVVGDRVIADEGVDVKEWLAKVSPGAKIGEMGVREAPTSNERLKRLLGFKEEFGWEAEWKKELEEKAEKKTKADV